MQEHFVEVELACLCVVEAVDHADEPGKTVFIVDVDVAVVGGHVAVAVVAGVVVVVVIDSIGSCGVVDMLVPVLLGAVVGGHGGIVGGNYVAGHRTIVGVEVPHDELVAVSARFGVEEDGVARAEVHVGELVDGVAFGISGPLVDVVVVVAHHCGADGSVVAVHPYARGDLYAGEVAACDGDDAACGV